MIYIHKIHLISDVNSYVLAAVLEHIDLTTLYIRKQVSTLVNMFT